MIKILFSLFLLLPSLAFGQWQEARMQAGILGGGVIASSSYLFSEDFDGSTSCLSGGVTTCNCLVDGSVSANCWAANPDADDYDFQETATKLLGTYSLQNNADATHLIYHTFSEQVALYGYFIVNATTLVNSNTVLNVNSSGGGTSLLTIQNVAPEIGGYCGTTLFYKGSSSWTQGQTYHIWFDYTDDGASSTCTICFSTDATRPSPAGNCTTTSSGTGTVGAGEIVIKHTQSSAVTVFDKIRLSTTQIGSNPD